MTLSEFQRLRRLVLSAIILAAFVSLVFVGSAWDGEIHEMVEAVGLGLIVAGIIGRLWCTLYIGGRKSSEIVDIGPYSLSRNPLYVFSSIAACGVGAQTGSVLLAVLFALGCAGAFQFVIRREEAFLARSFGAPYGDYLARVPRFWPDFANFRDAPTLVVATNRVYRTFNDGLVFFVAVPAFELVEYLQTTGVIHVALHLY